MARLSTHVLDTARGVPAAGVQIELAIVRSSGSETIARAVTNVNGRTDPPLLAGDRIEPGCYELTFHVGPYFRSAGPLADPPFFDVIVVRAGVADPNGDYHIPLLIAPYGYSVYRGA